MKQFNLLQWMTAINVPRILICRFFIQLLLLFKGSVENCFWGSWAWTALYSTAALSILVKWLNIREGSDTEGQGKTGQYTCLQRHENCVCSPFRLQTTPKPRRNNMQTMKMNVRLIPLGTTNNNRNWCGFFVSTTGIS